MVSSEKWRRAMSNKNLFLGLDTSNYTTSAAVVSECDEILEDIRIPLVVNEGEIGLRQSAALYQHWENLPGIIESLSGQYAERFKAVCVSEKPRPLEGSYMPVFKAGVAAAKIIAASLKIPLFYTTHQEGHIKAGAHQTSANLNKPLFAAHLSGGTLELIIIDKNRFDIVGGTKDISYGQLLDRTGALLGLSFPAGAKLDHSATTLIHTGRKNPLSPVFCEGTWLNLSGMETQLRTLVGKCSMEEIASYAFERIAESFSAIVQAATEKYGVEQILVTGGVASSSYLRKKWIASGYILGHAALCCDNAVGVALMKGCPLCQ